MDATRSAGVGITATGLVAAGAAIPLATRSVSPHRQLEEAQELRRSTHRAAEAADRSANFAAEQLHEFEKLVQAEPTPDNRRQYRIDEQDMQRLFADARDKRAQGTRLGEQIATASADLRHSHRIAIGAVGAAAALLGAGALLLHVAE